MEVLNSYGLVFGLAIGLLSAGFSFFNRQRYITLIKDIYQPGNDELRSQLGNARTEITELEKENVGFKTRYDEQQNRIKDLEKQNSRQADFAALAKTMSSNHKEVIETLSDLAKVIVEAKRGKK